MIRALSPPIISPSLLAADWAKMGEEASRIVAAGADWLHVDVMDNHFVPNLTMGPKMCSALRAYGITAPLDVHLMCQPVDGLIQAFAEAGATYLTIHAEATHHLDRDLDRIHHFGIKAGVALNPATPLSSLTHVLDKVDLVLLMTVNPGWGGQAFIPNSLEKIRACRQLIDTSAHSIHLSVDGGITADNVDEVRAAGATALVSGTTLFKASDPAKMIAKLKGNDETSG